MNSEMQAMEDTLRTIRAEYFAGLDERYEGIAKDWGIVSEGGGNELILDDLIRRVHNLAGSGALYGIRQLSTTARMFEDFLGAHAVGQGGEPGEAKALGDALLGALRIAMMSTTIEGDPLM